MSNPSGETGKILIFLGYRRPIRIVAADWPIIAKSVGKANTDIPVGGIITVRQHADGRAIVYAQNTDGFGRVYAGMTLPKNHDIAWALKQVGEACRLPTEQVQACVNLLPVEDVT